MQGIQPASFVIRTVHTNKNSVFENIKQVLSIKPQLIEFTQFQIDKVNVAKLDITNESNYNKKFSIRQPVKPYFQVVSKYKQLNGRQSCQIHIFFNPQKQKLYIQDEFSIKVQGQSCQLYVPIICKYISSKKISTSSKKLISGNKQNQELMARRMSIRKESIRRNLPIKRKCALVTLFNESTDYREMVVTTFLQRYQDICRYISQKKVKNEVFLGQKHITMRQRQQIEYYNSKTLDINRKILQQQIKTRYSIQYQSVGPLLQKINGLTLSWNSQRNISSIILKNGLYKLQEQIRLTVLSCRFNKIQKSLDIFKQYIQREKQLNKQLKYSQYFQFYKAKVSVDEINFDFQFNSTTIKRKELLIDYENMPRNDYFRQRNLSLEINQRIGFDNWIPMNTLKENNREIFRYEVQEISDNHIFMPINNKNIKKGAQMEMPYKNIIKIDEMSFIADNFSNTVQNKKQEISTQIWQIKRQCFSFKEQKDQGNLISYQDNLEQWLQTYIQHL